MSSAKKRRELARAQRAVMIAQLQRGSAEVEAAIFKGGCYKMQEEIDRLRLALRGLLEQVDRFCEQNGEADFETYDAHAALGDPVPRPVMTPNVQVQGRCAALYRAASPGTQCWTKPLRGGKPGGVVVLASRCDLAPSTEGYS